jgi:chitodextrinase
MNTFKFFQRLGIFVIAGIVFFMYCIPVNAKTVKQLYPDSSVVLAENLPAGSHTTTFYVDQAHPSASDLNPGTESLPWLTVQKAANTLNPGETVIVKPGSYEAITIKRSGTNENYITIKGVSSPDMSLMDSNEIYDPALKNYLPANAEKNAVIKGITFQGSESQYVEYVRVENFEITSASEPTWNRWVYFRNARHIELNNNFIHESKGQSSYGHAADNIVIRNNTLYRILNVGLTLYGKNWIIEDNEIMHGVIYNTFTGEKLSGDCDALRFFGTGHIIRGNFVHDYLDEEAAGHIDAMQTFTNNPEYNFAHDILIERNYFSNFAQMLMTADANEQQSGGTDTLSGITLRNNIFIGSRAAGILLGVNVNNFTIVNNTLVDTENTGLSIANNCHHTVVLNNIFYNNGGGAQIYRESSKPGSMFDYNLHYPDWSYPPKQPEYNINSIIGEDPEFVNLENPLGDDGIPFTNDDGLRLQKGSPATETGVFGSDMGAYGSFNDKAAPSAPSGLQVTGAVSNEVNLEWNESNDNTGVYDYIIHRDGKKIGTSPFLSYKDATVTDGNSYTYTVSAVDFSGNESAVSNQVVAVTAADTVAPRIISLSVGHNQNELIVEFNKKLDPASAETAANYVLNNDITVLSSSLDADGRTVTLTTSPLQKNVEYTLTVNGVLDRAATPNIIMPDTLVVFTCIMPRDDFADRNMDGWTVIDEGDISAPSSWGFSSYNGVYQTSWIYNGTGRTVDNRLGTFAYWDEQAALNWDNYELYAEIISMESAFGLLFRYQNPLNYYKLEFDSRQDFRRLIKKVNGVETVLASTDGSYPLSEMNKIRVNVHNDQIYAYINDEDIFGGPVTDGSLPMGSVALYTWLNRSASFSNIEVRRVRFSAEADTQPPSVPKGLSASVQSNSSVNLSWGPSSDNVGVAGYRIYRNGVQAATSAVNSYTDTGLASGTEYSYSIAAYDAAGNTSAKCPEVIATTGVGPTDPDDPDNPDDPDDPDDPDNPDNPDKPDDPDNPDKPDNPDNPDKPDNPDTPSTPPDDGDQDEMVPMIEEEDLITKDYPEMVEQLERLYESADIRDNKLNPTYSAMMKREPVISLTPKRQNRLKELAKLTFGDIKGNEWYASHIPMAVYRKLVNGFPDGTFRGSNQVTCAEFLTMMARFNNSEGLIKQKAEQDAQSRASIVKLMGDAWYTNYIVVAQDGLIYPDQYTRESIQKPMTRGEVFYALANYLWSEDIQEGGKYYQMAVDNKPSAFGDTTKTVNLTKPEANGSTAKSYNWYSQLVRALENPEAGVPMDFYPSIMCLKDKGILLGNKGESKWNDPISRAEALALFERLAKVWGEESN